MDLIGSKNAAVHCAKPFALHLTDMFLQETWQLQQINKLFSISKYKYFIWFCVKGMVALLAKITLPIKIAIVINIQWWKILKMFQTFLNNKFVTFLIRFQPIFVTTATDRQPKVVATATDHQPKVMTMATDFQPILMHYVHFAVSALNSSCSQM